MNDLQQNYIFLRGHYSRTCVIGYHVKQWSNKRLHLHIALWTCRARTSLSSNTPTEVQTPRIPDVFVNTGEFPNTAGLEEQAGIVSVDHTGRTSAPRAESDKPSAWRSNKQDSQHEQVSTT